jgi:hypothetical protein
MRRPADRGACRRYDKLAPVAPEPVLGLASGETRGAFLAASR